MARCRVLQIVLLLVLLLASPWAFSQSTFQKIIPNAGNPWVRNAQPSIDGGVTLYCGVENRFGASGGDIMVVSMNDLGDTVWTKVYGRWYFDRAHQLLRTSDNGYLIVGSTSVSASQNDDHILLIRTDALGDILWTKSYQGLDPWLSAIECIDGGFLLIGHPNGGLYMIRVGEQGDMLWSKYYDRHEPPDFESGITANSVVQLSDSSFFVVGSRYSSAFLSKIDRNGLLQWTKMATSDTWVSFNRIVRAADGGFMILGGKQSFCLVKIDSLGNSIWTKACSIPSGGWPRELLITSDGGFAMVGGTNAPSGPTDNIYFLKLDSNGDPVFSRVFGDTGFKVGQGVVKAQDGGFFVVALVVNSGSPYSMYVVKTDSNGFGDCDQHDIETTTQSIDLEWNDLQLQSYSFTPTEQPVSLMISSGATLMPLCPVGVNDHPGSSAPIQVFPNPAADRLTVAFPLNYAQSQIELFNALGDRVLTGRATSAQTSIDCSPFSRGIYLVKVTTPTTTVTQRVVLE